MAQLNDLLSAAGITVTRDTPGHVTIITPGVEEPMSLTLTDGVALALARALTYGHFAERSKLAFATKSLAPFGEG